MAGNNSELKNTCQKMTLNYQIIRGGGQKSHPGQHIISYGDNNAASRLNKVIPLMQREAEGEGGGAKPQIEGIAGT